MIGAFQAGVLMSGAAFTDPRAGKTNLISGATTSGNLSFGAAITGPDGTLSGVRATSTGTNGRIAIPSFGLTIGNTYTVGAYFVTPSDQGIPVFLADGSATPGTGTPTNIGYRPTWTLVECQMVALNASSYLWMGANNVWTTGEWVEYALPMVYLGNKVT